MESCAPAPLWSLLPALSGRFPGMTISSSLEEVAQIGAHVAEGVCEMGILPEAVCLEGVRCVPFLREELYVCIPENHELAGCESVTFEMLNGFNCLLRSEIGFWDAMCRRKMPASRFLVQTDEFEMRELILKSSLLCFVTNLSGAGDGVMRGRKTVPIADPEAKVVYHLIYREEKKEYEGVCQTLL